MQITLVCCSIRESPGGVCSVIEMSLSLPAFINKRSYFNTTFVKFTAAITALSGRGKPASPSATLAGCRILMLVLPRKNSNFVLTPPTWPCSSLAQQMLQGGSWQGCGTDRFLFARGSKLCPLLPCSSAMCFALLRGRSQGLVPLLALEVGAITGSVGGCIGGWGSQRKVQSPLLTLGPGSCHLHRATSARGLCVSGCILLWGCLHCG